MPVRVGATLAIRRDDIPGLSSLNSRDDSPLERLLTVHEAAARLGCPPRVIRTLAAQGELRTIEIGGTKRWSPADVEDLRKRGIPNVG